MPADLGPEIMFHMISGFPSVKKITHKLSAQKDTEPGCKKEVIGKI